MSEQFDHRSIEERWQARWQAAGVFRWRNDEQKQKSYVLEMFPYTSGRLHIGHARNYAMGDTLARLHRAQGRDVLYPMGWDAFGLPAENAAITSGTHPRLFTINARKSMKAAMGRLGLSYDWTCEIDTSEPEYMRAQQWLFLRMFERGLVYRDASYVNWCPKCATVLANEQVIAGKCWRCQSNVVKRHVPQWFFETRKYAAELLDSLDHLPGWPESLKGIQRAWIGRSQGTEIVFPVEGEAEPLRVFTTRADTLFGCTFVVLAPEHPLLDRLQMSDEHRAEMEHFRQTVMAQPTEERTMPDKEKFGSPTGRFAINPINGERVPIWSANYVLMDYGTGAVMCVAAHDERDFAFATRYGLPVRRVILGPDQQPDAPLTAAYVGDGRLVNSADFDGIPNSEAGAAITARLAERGQGAASTQYRLQNWSLSRQRYWGNPIPIIHCPKCGALPVNDDDLPVLLPESIDFSGHGSPLSRSASYMNVPCPRCGEPAQRDPDTMDTFVDSSWYFLRFPTPKLKAPFDQAIVARMLPVDIYIGGLEHATLHLMYSRFFVKVLRDLGMLSFNEPFERIYNHGMVNDEHGRKQSKSLGNVVDPTSVVDVYGADSLRVYLLFATAYNAPLDWIDTGPKDAQAYLQRVFRLEPRLREALTATRSIGDEAMQRGGDAGRELNELLHATIAKVTVDVERLQFNTAIAALMKLTNSIYAYPSTEDASPAAAAYRVLIRLLSVFAPHLCEELWERIGTGGLLAEHPWPEADPEMLALSIVEVAVQVNGKFVTTLRVARDTPEGDVVVALGENALLSNRLKNKSVRRTIFVPNRLVNFVVS